MLGTFGTALGAGPAGQPEHLAAPPAALDAIARYYTTVVQGLSIQARDGTTRADLKAVITCAVAAWDALTAAHPVG